MRYLDIEQILELHRMLIEESGGSHGVRDAGSILKAIAQPEMAFGGQELYPTIVDKASTLAFSLIMNHPFVDGNKRIGHAAMAVFLDLNGHEIVASVDEQENLILGLAAGNIDRAEFTTWLRDHVVEKQ